MTNFHVLGFENNMQDSFGGLVSVYLDHGSPNYDCGQVNWKFPLHAINNRQKVILHMQWSSYVISPSSFR